MPENKEFDLFEHVKSNVIKGLEFADFERFLDKIWENRPQDGFFYGNEKEKVSTKQRFFKLNYKDQTITPRNYVGTVIFKDFTFNVYPKVFDKPDKKLFAENLLYWLSYIDRFKFPRFESDQKRSSSDMLDVFIWLFSTYTLETLYASPYQQYEEVTEETSAIKGKLEFGDYIKNIAKGMWHKPVCSFSSFEYDNVFNQVVKATCQMLLQLQSLKETNRKTLDEIVFLLDDVTDTCVTSSDCDKIVLNPMFSHLKPIVEYCRLFLSSAIHSTDSGKLSLFAFLVPMEKIYEEFLLGFIKEHVNSKAGAKNGKLDENGIYKIKKDIEIPDSCIIDAKYKIPKNFKPAQSDMYQMIAYSIRSKIDRVLLIYPEKNQERTKSFEIKDEFADKIIKIKAATVPFASQSNPEMLKARLKFLIISL